MEVISNENNTLRFIPSKEWIRTTSQNFNNFHRELCQWFATRPEPLISCFCLGVIWLHIYGSSGCAQLHHFLSHRKKFPPQKPSLNFKILIGCHCSCTNSRHRILRAKTSQEGMDLGPQCQRHLQYSVNMIYEYDMNQMRAESEPKIIGLIWPTLHCTSFKMIHLSAKLNSSCHGYNPSGQSILGDTGMNGVHEIGNLKWTPVINSHIDEVLSWKTTIITQAYNIETCWNHHLLKVLFAWAAMKQPGENVLKSIIFTIPRHRQPTGTCMLTISHTGGPEADERSVQIPARTVRAEKLHHLSTGAGFQAPEVLVKKNMRHLLEYLSHLYPFILKHIFLQMKAQ